MALELARRELEHGRVVDVAPSGNHVLVYGSDRRAEGWDLALLAVSAEVLLGEIERGLGVRLEGSELRLGDD